MVLLTAPSRSFLSPPTVSAIFSATMTDAYAEFHDPERIELLDALKTAVDSDVISSPTVWACLWLSNIDRLRELVRLAQMNPFWVLPTFQNIESSIRLVQTCRFYKSDLLIT